jgi:hypothetical protein
MASAEAPRTNPAPTSSSGQAGAATLATSSAVQTMAVAQKDETHDRRSWVGWLAGWLGWLAKLQAALAEVTPVGGKRVRAGQLRSDLPSANQ